MTRSKINDDDTKEAFEVWLKREPSYASAIGPATVMIQKAFEAGFSAGIGTAIDRYVNHVESDPEFKKWLEYKK